MFSVTVAKGQLEEMMVMLEAGQTGWRLARVAWGGCDEAGGRSENADLSGCLGS